MNTYSPSEAPGSGKDYCSYLLSQVDNLPQKCHLLWYDEHAQMLRRPELYAFRGKPPVGETLELITLGGEPLSAGKNVKPARDGSYQYTIRNGTETIYKADLSPGEIARLGIPEDAGNDEKVYNANFVPWDELSDAVRVSNQLACISVPQSINFYFRSRGNPDYSQKAVYDFLVVAASDHASEEMSYLLHGALLAWQYPMLVRTNGHTRIFLEREDPVDMRNKVNAVMPIISFALAGMAAFPGSYR